MFLGETSTNFHDGSLGTIAVGVDELHVLFVDDEVYDQAPDTGWSTYRATR